MPRTSKARNSVGRDPKKTSGRFVALVRGVNVGGRGKLAMADLREVLGQLGYADVVTVLQSGNAVFSAGDRIPALLERAIERGVSECLDLTVDVLVRTASEWEELIAANPFAREAGIDASHLLVLFMKRRVTEREAAALQAEVLGPEVIRASGRELYVVYPEGIGRSRVTGNWIERQLSSSGTGRNWNTVLRIGRSLSA